MGLAENLSVLRYFLRMSKMTRQEREERDAAFAQLLEETRSGKTGERGLGSELHRGIATARRRLGWTQSELARRIGTTQSAIAELESGRVLPRLRTLHRLAEVLGVRLTVRLDPI
jgi:ribosome-binding protein aMBF1 (putative translation factor)